MHQNSTITREVTLTTMPPVFLRGEHVQVFLRTADGKYLLGAKNMYPEGIVRLVGGGLDEDTPVAGAIREVEEELQIRLSPEQLVPLARITYQISHTEDIVFTAHLFFAEISETVTPSDDLDGVVALTSAEVADLVTAYQNLTDETLPDLGFSWKDYGIIFGDLHQTALKKVAELKL